MQRTSQQIICPVLILLLLASGGCSREEPDPVPAEIPGVEIPLGTIWGHSIPEAQSIHLLDLEHLQKLSEQEWEDLPQTSLMRQIAIAIWRQEDKQPIGPGFAVAGSGYEALVAAKEIMKQDQIPPQIFPAGTEVSLFFYTRKIGMGEGFRLKEIRQSKEAVTIRYRCGTGGTGGTRRFHISSSTCYFASIPIGKPAAGNHTVDIVRLPMKERYSKRDQPSGRGPIEERICKSFSFSIESVGDETDIDE